MGEASGNEKGGRLEPLAGWGEIGTAGELSRLDRVEANPMGRVLEYRWGVGRVGQADWVALCGLSGARSRFVTWTTWSAWASPWSSRSDDSGSVSEVTTCRTVSGRNCTSRQGTGGGGVQGRNRGLS
jgi:hypothetical protein